MPLHGGCGNLLSARGFQPLPVPALAALRSLQCIWGVFYYSNALGTAAVRLEIPLSSPSGKIPTPASPPALIHTATAAVFLQTSAYNHAEFEPPGLCGDGRCRASLGARQRLACPVDYIVAHTCIASFRQPSLRNIISIDKFVCFPAFHSAAARSQNSVRSSFIRSYGNIIQ